MDTYAEMQAKRDAEMRRQMDVAGTPNGVIGLPGTLGGIPTPAAPMNEQIRGLIGEVSDAADVVAEKRETSLRASMALAESEARFAELSSRLQQMLEQHRAAGNGLNSPRGLR